MPFQETFAYICLLYFDVKPILQNSQKTNCPIALFLLNLHEKETSAQLFHREFYETFKNTFLLNTSGCFFIATLFRVGLFLSVAYLEVANLAQFGISVHFQVSVKSQYLVRLLSYCWIAGGHTIHPPIKGLLPLTGIEPTLF